MIEHLNFVVIGAVESPEFLCLVFWSFLVDYSLTSNGSPSHAQSSTTQSFCLLCRPDLLGALLFELLHPGYSSASHKNLVQSSALLITCSYRADFPPLS
jgi:hypothetical protein